MRHNTVLIVLAAIFSVLVAADFRSDFRKLREAQNQQLRESAKQVRFEQQDMSMLELCRKRRNTCLQQQTVDGFSGHGFSEDTPPAFQQCCKSYAACASGAGYMVTDA